MTLLLAAAAVILLMFLSGLCSGMETGFYALDRVRLQLRAEEGDGRARRLLVAAARPAVAVCALLLANNVVNYFVSDAASALLDGVAPSSGGVLRQVLDTLAVTPFLFVLGDLAPKDAFLRAPTRLMLRFEPFFRLILAAFGPAAAPFLWLGRKIGGEGAGLAREETVFERAALGRLLTEEEEVAGLSPAQRDFAKRVLRLRTVRVADRMTPVKAVAAVRLDAKASEIAALGAAVKRSRLPVWAPGGRIFAGYVNVTEAAVLGDDSAPASRFLHELPSVTLGAPVAAALVRFQKRRKPLMQVVDPVRGETVGILAASDLVDALFD